ncbi:MAG: hypothetical protein HYW78_00210 [Parcubacteria group bacterium]|nr:hypothetical protein [Parcubacteria group bacterium]
MNAVFDENKFKQLIEKIESLKKRGGYDLSMEEDLSIAIMNLISLEEHFFFTGEKTGKGEYFDLLNETRSIRKELLAKIIPVNEGETWCISKHLLAATMRLIEVGTKLYSQEKREEAKRVFNQANKIYSLFWAVRLKLIDLSNAKKIEDQQLNVHDTEADNKPWTTEDILKKLVNCCDE